MRGDNDIFAATKPEPYQVLGLELKPFALGHYFTLKRFNCAFVSDEAEQLTREDLILACLVCSMPAGHFDEWANSGKLTFLEKASVWFRLICGKASKAEFAAACACDRWEVEVVRWGNSIGAFDLEAKAKMFLAYLSESGRFPKYWVEREDTSPSGSHWAHSVLISLTGKLGFTEERAMTMPLREALLHFFKQAEMDGAVRLMTQEEIELTEVACG
jgi:hypothetical protein